MNEGLSMPTKEQPTKMECTKCGHTFLIDKIVTDPFECVHILVTDVPPGFYIGFEALRLQAAAGRQRDFLRSQKTSLTYRTGVHQGEQT